MNNFQHRHYEAIAKLLKHRLEAAENYKDPAKRDSAVATVDGIAVDFNRLFASDNSRYSSERFYKACGISA